MKPNTSSCTVGVEVALQTNRIFSLSIWGLYAISGYMLVIAYFGRTPFSALTFAILLASFAAICSRQKSLVVASLFPLFLAIYVFGFFWTGRQMNAGSVILLCVGSASSFGLIHSLIRFKHGGNVENVKQSIRDIPEMSPESRRLTTRNLLVLFSLLFVATSTLDQITSVIFLNLGYPEMNPLKKEWSRPAIVVFDLLVLLLGLCSVAFGVRIRKEDVRLSAANGYKAFRKTFFAGWRSLFVLVPIIIAASRILGPINNIMLVELGYGFIASKPPLFFEVGDFYVNSNHVTTIVLVLPFVLLANYLIYLACRGRQ